ncbi:MAG: hypothetical protein IKJ27_02230 [Clostridia bacterium]|nr:hypothetical protein [Clostridia bacterium]
MKQKIFNKKKYPKACSNCLYGRTPKDNQSVLCEINGIVDLNDKCRHYEYDPLKRKPERIVINSEYTAEDFKL